MKLKEKECLKNTGQQWHDWRVTLSDSLRTLKTSEIVFPGSAIDQESGTCIQSKKLSYHLVPKERGGVYYYFTPANEWHSANFVSNLQCASNWEACLLLVIVFSAQLKIEVNQIQKLRRRELLRSAAATEPLCTITRHKPLTNLLLIKTKSSQKLREGCQSLENFLH